MTSRATLAALLLFSTATGVQAEPIFAPVPQGFVGTAFRGVALGQTRAEVELALAAIGKRCVANEDLIDEMGSEYHFYVERYDGYSTCRIADVGIPASQTYAHNMNVLTVELVFGLPLYAVSYLDDRAAALSFMPEYFNAAGSTPFAFAQSIADSYGVASFEPTESGWRGLSQSGELVQIWRGNATAPLWMTVFLGTEANTPTFN